LSLSKRRLVGLNLVKGSPDFRFPLRGHAAVRIKLDRIVCHGDAMYLLVPKISHSSEIASVDG
jgi:hypothetical protein